MTVTVYNPLIILMVLVKITKLNKIDENIITKLKTKKNRTKLKKLNEN